MKDVAGLFDRLMGKMVYNCMLGFGCEAFYDYIMLRKRPKRADCFADLRTIEIAAPRENNCNRPFCHESSVWKVTY